MVDTAASPPSSSQNAPPQETGERFSTGILPSQDLREAIAKGQITASIPIEEAQIQPASLDLRLGEVAYRLQTSFLPGPNARVEDKVKALSMHTIDLRDGAVLEQGCVYIVPLMEGLALAKKTTAIANPKSSTGRLDIFARVITDYGNEFDHIRASYEGPLWAEISPRSFSILVRSGARLTQLRLKQGTPRAGQGAIRRLQDEAKLVDAGGSEAGVHRGMVAISVDTRGDGSGQIIGFRAKKHAALLDVSLVDHYDPLEFWEPLYPSRSGGLILDPDEFYILASKEAVTVPPDYAAEMVAYDTLVGEFRVHYAGFFDPGFGHADSGGSGSRAVLEVRSHEVPFLIEDGQIVGRLFYERLTAVPDRLYGAGIGSNYQRQGLQLSKQFKPPER